MDDLIGHVVASSRCASGFFEFLSLLPLLLPTSCQLEVELKLVFSVEGVDLAQNLPHYCTGHFNTSVGDYISFNPRHTHLPRRGPTRHRPQPRQIHIPSRAIRAFGIAMAD